MFRTRTAFRSLLALGLLGLAAPGHAITTFCVHDAQELSDAIAAVGLGDTPVVINVRKGTYDASASSNSFYLPMTHSNQLVGISGGWSGDNGACTTHSNDASGTVIVGAADRRPVWINTDPTNTHTNNTVYVSDLTLRNPTGLGYGVCLNATVSTGSSLTLERLRLEQCVSQNGSSASAALSNSGQLVLRNIVVRDGQAAGANGGIGVTTKSGGTSRLSQLSITGTSSGLASAPANGLDVSHPSNDGSTTNVSNSVVWGNATDFDTKDVKVIGAGIHFSRVHYGSLGGTPASNNTPGTGDPGFVAPGDPHLRSNSILIDSGIASPDGGTGSYDADGKTRLQGVAVDVGAYEWSDKIFASSFEN
jgi:hypothetical protein